MKKYSRSSSYATRRVVVHFANGVRTSRNGFLDERRATYLSLWPSKNLLKAYLAVGLNTEIAAVVSGAGGD